MASSTAVLMAATVLMCMAEHVPLGDIPEVVMYMAEHVPLGGILEVVMYTILPLWSQEDEGSLGKDASLQEVRPPFAFALKYLLWLL